MTLPFFVYDIEEGFFEELVPLNRSSYTPRLLTTSCKAASDFEPDADWIYVHDTQSRAMFVESELELYRVNVGSFF